MFNSLFLLIFRTLGQYPPLFSESFENGSQPQKNFNRTFSNGVSQYHDVFFNVGKYALANNLNILFYVMKKIDQKVKFLLKNNTSGSPASLILSFFKSLKIMSTLIV